MWPLSRVSPLVLPQSGLLRERTPAHATLVRSLPRVDPQVLDQVALPPKRLLADLALVRLLANVDPFVVLQAGPLCKGPVAIAAAEGLSHVRSFMHFEVWGAVAKVRAVATPVPVLQMIWLALLHIWRILRGREVALAVSGVEALLFNNWLCLDKILC